MISVDLAASVAFFAALTAIGALLIWRAKHPRTDRFVRAQQQFSEARLEASNPRYSYSSNTAQVIRTLRDNTDGESTTYTLTVYARNPSGEYFVFRSDGSSPSVAYLEHSLAKIILKDTYLPPLSEQ